MCLRMARLDTHGHYTHDSKCIVIFLYPQRNERSVTRTDGHQHEFDASKEKDRLASENHAKGRVFDGQAEISDEQSAL